MYSLEVNKESAASYISCKKIMYQNVKIRLFLCDYRYIYILVHIYIFIVRLHASSMLVTYEYIYNNELIISLFPISTTILIFPEVRFIRHDGLTIEYRLSEV